MSTSGGSSSGMTTGQGGRHGAAPMRPMFLEAAGDPPVQWQVWQAMFKDHMVAYDLDGLAEARKVALLKSSLGTEGYKVCLHLCPEDDLTLNEVLARLSSRFSPKVSKIYARSIFHRRSQLQGETCIQFVSSLRVLIAKCDYNDAVKVELLRDRFVAGCLSDKIREKLLLENDDMTLDQALVIANNCERVAVENKNVVSLHIDDSSVNKIASQRRNRSTGGLVKGACFSCGKFGHHKGDDKCPARGRKCTVCNGPNHFAAVCKFKQQDDRGRQRGRGRGQKGQQYGGQLRSGQSGTEFSDTGSQRIRTINVSVDSVDSMFKPSMAVQCLINEQAVCLVCDTGAKVSILNESTVMKLHLRVLPDVDLVLKTYTGSVIKTLGIVKASVQCADKYVHNFSFVVVKTGSNIMGLDLFDALGYRIGVPYHNENVCHSCSTNRVGVNSVSSLSEHRFRAIFSDLFKQPEVILGFVHKPMVDSTVVPRAQAMRRVPIALHDDVAQELKRMVDDGILEPIDAGEWVSNMVVVRKPTGGVRICCDLTDVNRAIIPDRFPLPTIAELSCNMAGAKVFSKIDLRQGYLQVSLDPESRYLTSMITPLGLMQWTRLPPGMCSAPSCFQKIISVILKDCDGVVNLLDDILVGGRTVKEHDDRLFKVLCRLRDAHVRLHGEKTVFGVAELDFVGLHVTEHGVSPLRSSVEAVQNIPAPTNVKQLRSFLGSVGFYSKFIGNFAYVAEPLYYLLRKNITWYWSEQCNESFNRLKEALTSSPVLVHFNSNKKTVVECDASQSAIGCVLLQEQGGVEKPVAYASRVLNQAERGYSVCEKEALACLFACEHWHYYLYARKFTLRTDHRSLTTLLNSQGEGRKPLRLARWYDRLQQYAFVVEYKPGGDNCMADMLSRTPTAMSSTSEVDVCTVMSIFGDSRVSVISEQELVNETSSDVILCQIIKFVQDGWLNKDELNDECKPYYSERDVLSVLNGCLVHNDVVVIPTTLRDKMVSLAHEGHPGVVRTLQRLREVAWWPSMSKLVKSKIDSCVACAANSDCNVTRCTPLIPVEWPKYAWSKIAIDIVGELTNVPYAKRFAVSVIDYHSRWAEVYFFSTVTSAVIVKCLTDLFSRFGLPEVLVSDNGVQFVSNEFELFLKSCNIKHVKSSLFFPQSNGLVERFNRTLKEAIRMAVAEGQAVEDSVRNMLVTYRSTAQPATGQSPSQLMFGRQIRVPVNAFASIRSKVQFNGNGGALDNGVLDSGGGSRDNSGTQVETRVMQFQQKMAQQFNRRHRVVTPKFSVDDWVRVRMANRRHKTDASFSEPHRIVKFVAPFTVLLSNNTKWHMSKLKRSLPPNEDCHILLDDEEEEQASVEPQAIVVAPPVGSEALVSEEDSEIRRSGRIRKPPAWHKDYNCHWRGK